MVALEAILQFLPFSLLFGLFVSWLFLYNDGQSVKKSVMGVIVVTIAFSLLAGFCGFVEGSWVPFIRGLFA